MDSIGTLRLRVPLSGGDHRADREAATAALASATSRTITDASSADRVILVKHLALDIPVPRRDSAPALAAAAGERLDASVRRALARGMATPDIITFDSQAEYIAHFIEQYLYDRPLDAWYLRPLAPFAATTLEATLRRLAQAESVAWPAVLALLRERELIPRLLRGLPAGAHALVVADGSVVRSLTRDEARPLFTVAWRIAAALLHEIVGSSPQLRLAFPAELTAPVTLEVALDRYMRRHPVAPRTWANPTLLGEAVAEMVRWLSLHASAPRRATNAAVSALGAYLWLDPLPITKLLRAIEDASPASTVRNVARDLGRSPVTRPDGQVPLANRPQALVWLDAAIALERTAAAGRIAALPQAHRAGDAHAVLQQLVAQLRPLARWRAVGAIESLLDGSANAEVVASQAPALARVRAVVRALRRDEIRSLAAALSRAIGTAPSGGVEFRSGAAGVLFLIRPLIELRIHSAAARAGYDAAQVRALLREVVHVAAGDKGEGDLARVFSTGGLEPEPSVTSVPAAEQVSTLRAELLSNAAVWRLSLSSLPADAPLAECALSLACGQLVRWMHGFERSSLRFVVQRVLRNAGLIRVSAGGVAVEWPLSGFDVLLERAGYLEPLESVPWWDNRGIRWLR